ncbi:MAG TPA: uL15 family ribosomal protein [Candidatus Paceibacterota bacterium]|nr:uL15 family ribosomal protein [Candidatus Paceibacterota bacterium]
MQLHSLKRVHANKKKRYVGRGGKRGKTSGRGTKGQLARSGRKLRPELRDIIKKLPKLRGRGKNSFKSIVVKPVTVTLSAIDKRFGAGETVSPATLAEKKLLIRFGGKNAAVKVVGGTLSKALSFTGLALSAPARKEVESKGGSVA